MSLCNRRYGGGKHCGQWRNFHDTFDREVRDDFHRKRKQHRDAVDAQDLDEIIEFVPKRRYKVG